MTDPGGTAPTETDDTLYRSFFGATEAAARAEAAAWTEARPSDGYVPTRFEWDPGRETLTVTYTRRRLPVSLPLPARRNAFGAPPAQRQDPDAQLSRGTTLLARGLEIAALAGLVALVIYAIGRITG
jgi:hypothetical protein